MVPLSFSIFLDGSPNLLVTSFTVVSLVTKRLFASLNVTSFVAENVQSILPTLHSEKVFVFALKLIAVSVILLPSLRTSPAARASADTLIRIQQASSEA